MKITQLLFIIIPVLVAFVISVTGVSCANMAPPMGGPKDTLPPVLVNVTPADSTLNFAGKKILISFNEYIQLEDIQKNLLVNPTPKVNPTVEHRLRTINITLRDTLEENTTYTLDFGKAIKDLNEGNPFRNYRYIFSTGRSLDSLTLGGRVVVAETGRPDSTLIVMLYNLFDDSAVIKERPRYVARVDSSGYFRFRNLEPDTFAIYALKDEGARRYLSKQQLFAFHDSTVHSTSQRNNIMLYAYSEKDTSKKPEPAEPQVERGGRKPDRALNMQSSVSDGGQQDLLSNLELTFGIPLSVFDSTKIMLADTNFRKLPGYSFRRDTSGKKISLVYPWAENTMYKLVIDTAFAQDTSGRKLLKTDTITFQSKQSSDYGSLRLRFTGLPLERNPVLAFVQGETIKFSQALTTNQFYARLFQPGDYELRIIFDENRNGLWDTGQFFGVKRQPEKAQSIPGKLSIKANWDNERDVEL